MVMVHKIETATLVEMHLNFPQGYRLSPVTGGNPTAIEDFIATRNRNFRELAGSSDQRAEDLAAFIGTISVDTGPHPLSSGDSRGRWHEGSLPVCQRR